MWGRKTRHGVESACERQSARQQPVPIGASSEAQLAWPGLSSPCGHLCKLSRPVEPRIAFFRAPPYDSSHGTRSLHRAWTCTEENGSGWAAQRLGGRLDVWRLRETAERAPIASTPVASRSPVMQSGFVGIGGSRFGGSRSAVRGLAVRGLAVCVLPAPLRHFPIQHLQHRLQVLPHRLLELRAPQQERGVIRRHDRDASPFAP